MTTLMILGGVLGGAGVIAALLRTRRSRDWGSLHSALDGAIRQTRPDAKDRRDPPSDLGCA